MKTAIRFLIMTAMILGALTTFLTGNILGAWSLISLGILSEVLFRLGIVDGAGPDSKH
ncbi:hypothetical protein [Shewanella sp. GXUN23E]|uniref:hypothetical protein n=1 Tax=Shewanella sp. GXUN23E TaxID=3422498 RepID=UPI003D7DFE96